MGISISASMNGSDPLEVGSTPTFPANKFKGENMKNTTKILIGALTFVTLFSNFSAQAGKWKSFDEALSNPKTKTVFGNSDQKKKENNSKKLKQKPKQDKENDYSCDDSMDPTVHQVIYEDWFESWTIDEKGKDIYEVWKMKTLNKWERIYWHYIEKE